MPGRILLNVLYRVFGLSLASFNADMIFNHNISKQLRHLGTIGSLNNDDGEVDENGKKALGLDFHNNFARASPFFVHFFAVNARLRRENA